MNKQQDSDLEKGRETISEIELSFEGDRTPIFEGDDDPFEQHVIEEFELEYEPEGSFLD